MKATRRVRPERLAGAPDPLADGSLSIDTPEQVAVDLPLAGLGSRFAALCLDGLCIAALLLLLWGVVHIIAGLDGETAVVVLILGAFALVWGWFFVFEAFADGVTPGKRRVGLRVVQDGGEALSIPSAAIRNLLRLIDLQPGGTGLLGGAVMLLHPRGKRLGDLVAGTVVVRDLPEEFPPLPEAREAAGPPRIDDEAFAALERFLARHEALSPKARAELVRRHAAALGLHGGGLMALYNFHAEERDRRAARHVASGGGAVALVRARQQRWRTFQARLARLGRGRWGELTDDAASDFAAAYRAVAADLARARTLGVGAQTRWALERLVARAHGRFHRPARHGRGRFLEFLRGGLPRAVRRHSAAFVAALVAFYGSGLLVHALVTGDPTLEPLLVPSEMIDRAERAAANPHFDYRDTISEAWLGGGLLAGFVLANNLQVTFLTFGAGIFAGLGSLFVLLLNGVSLGGVFGAFTNRGVEGNLIAWVAPHGPFELTAIALAGAAGFVVGSALWAPGRLTRGQALVERGRDGLRLLGGAALLMILAAPLEGFAAPARVPDGAKHAIGVVCTALLVLYFAFAGRGEAAADVGGDAVTARRGA